MPRKLSTSTTDVALRPVPCSRTQPSMDTPARKYTIVELYAGTARSADAFRQWRRSRIGLLVDQDEHAAATYRHNHRKAPYLVTNVKALRPAEIEAKAGGKVDILLGCPPCQGFSDTGARNEQDPRNSHLTRFGLLAEQLQPLAIAMENVPLAGGTWRFERFAERMKAAGYRSTWGILNAALRGSAQCRHRLVYIGIRNDVGVAPQIAPPRFGTGGTYFNYATGAMAPISADPITMLSEPPAARRVRKAMPYTEFKFGPKSIPTIQQALDGLPQIGSAEADRLSHARWQHTPAMIQRMAEVAEGGRWAGGADHFSHSYGRLHRTGLSRTITTFFSNPGSGRFWHPSEDRALSIREAARIQGFPDDFAFLDYPTGNCRLVGNALDGHLADVTYRTIRACLG